MRTLVVAVVGSGERLHLLDHGLPRLERSLHGLGGENLKKFRRTVLPHEHDLSADRGHGRLRREALEDDVVGGRIRSADDYRKRHII